MLMAIIETQLKELKKNDKMLIYIYIYIYIIVGFFTTT